MDTYSIGLDLVWGRYTNKPVEAAARWELGKPSSLNDWSEPDDFRSELGGWHEHLSFLWCSLLCYLLCCPVHSIADDLSEQAGWVTWTMLVTSQQSFCSSLPAHGRAHHRLSSPSSSVASKDQGEPQPTSWAQLRAAKQGRQLDGSMMISGSQTREWGSEGPCYDCWCPWCRCWWGRPGLLPRAPRRRLFHQHQYIGGLASTPLPSVAKTTTLMRQVLLWIIHSVHMLLYDIFDITVIRQTGAIENNKQIFRTNLTGIKVKV